MNILSVCDWQTENFASKLCTWSMSGSVEEEPLPGVLGGDDEELVLRVIPVFNFSGMSI